MRLAPHGAGRAREHPAQRGPRTPSGASGDAGGAASPADGVLGPSGRRRRRSRRPSAVQRPAGALARSRGVTRRAVADEAITELTFSLAAALHSGAELRSAERAEPSAARARAEVAGSQLRRVGSLLEFDREVARMPRAEQAARDALAEQEASAARQLQAAARAESATVSATARGGSVTSMLPGSGGSLHAACDLLNSDDHPSESHETQPRDQDAAAATPQSAYSPRSRASPLGSEDVTVGGCRFTLGLELGRGGYGVVFSAQRTDATGNTAAVALKLTAAERNTFPRHLERARRTTGPDFKHPNLVDTMLVEELHIADHAVAQQALGQIADGAQYYWTAMQLCQTDVVQALHCWRQDGKRLSARAAYCWAMQVAKALHHLASKNIVHGDVKAENLLVDPSWQTVVLADLEGSFTAGSRDASKAGTYPYLDANVATGMVEPGLLSWGWSSTSS
eukprot:TRINITY_DN23123_c0_g2_i2.p1 TRINITY_DN23123_c0_g2~~TRINITY_DN23123_c0_g2_i2.p1  ORF type:complete len:453 (+),score=53.27 TRINITY_DN23123_c0_g2_i2:394-1752(+)